MPHTNIPLLQMLVLLSYSRFALRIQSYNRKNLSIFARSDMQYCSGSSSSPQSIRKHWVTFKAHFPPSPPTRLSSDCTLRNTFSQTVLEYALPNIFPQRQNHQEMQVKKAYNSPTLVGEQRTYIQKKMDCMLSGREKKENCRHFSPLEREKKISLLFVQLLLIRIFSQFFPSNHEM